MTRIAQIVLPHGTTYVTVGDIPNLIAHALYPIPTERHVSHLKKAERGRNRTVELTPEDWKYLSGIWKHLPPYADGIPELKWRAYESAFNCAPDKPDWLLVPLEIDGPVSRAGKREDAERLHKEALEDAIRSSRLVARTHALTQASSWDGVLPTAKILVEDFTEYCAELSVHVRVESANQTAMRRAVAERSTIGAVARDLAADRALIADGHSTDDASTRTDIKAAIIEAHILADIQKLLDQGAIAPRTDERGTRAVRPSAIDKSWYLTRRDLEIVLQYTKGDEEAKSEYLRELSSHLETGRYTLRQASDLIESEGGEDYKSILKRLKLAALNDELAMYLPGRNQKYDYGPQPRRFLSVHDFYEEAYWNDLNSWLDRYEPRIACRFPAPKSQPQWECVDEGGREDHDPKLVYVQQAYNEIHGETGKAPSQRAVALRSGYARETVRSMWSRLKKLDQPT